ncbi:MAG: site-specific DNA-methyltransferase, partial [Candidatus Falkowbacteria bacterium]|nr:site-specific DNA-methyltransferase [Candidatus Falkowbacteria bacterium]
MDEIFGENRLVNEIIWHYNRWTAQSKAYQHMHDTILWYSKTDNYIYNMQYKEYAEGSKRAHEERGYIQRGSYISKPNPKGVVADDVWNINFPGPSAERTGFPTQKPEVLLERIIKASSNSGDIVFDAFAGSGTTGAVAEKLGRRWIMIDSSKLAIYTMQKRFLNLRKEIGDRGLKLTPKPFTLYNAGLYDYQKIKELPWEQYRDFALKLFQCRDGKHRISGIDLDGYLGPYDVLVFNYQKYKNITLDYGFIDDLHKSLGNKIGKWFFIITPAANVQFLEDYVERGGIKYFILRIPYSIISEIHQKGFLAIKQPVSVYDVNDVMEAVGFDFIQVPKVGCQYYLAKSKGAGPLKLGKGKIEVIIKIKTFKSETLSQEAQDLKNLESLSMVMIDYNYNGKIFDLDEVFYAEDLRNQNYEIRFDFNEIKGQMMLIYCDIFGNEKREIKTLKDFKK